MKSVTFFLLNYFIFLCFAFFLLFKAVNYQINVHCNPHELLYPSYFHARPLSPVGTVNGWPIPSHLRPHILTALNGFPAYDRFFSLQMARHVRYVAVHQTDGVRVKRIAAPRVVLGVALVTYYGFRTCGKAHVWWVIVDVPGTRMRRGRHPSAGNSAIMDNKTMSRVERHRKSESFRTRLNPLQTAVNGMSNHNEYNVREQENFYWTLTTAGFIYSFFFFQLAPTQFSFL